MGCSGRRHYDDIRPEQKWDFISLNDFKVTSCFEPLAYAYLLVSLVVSVVVYALDTFTAVQLLAFNHWSSEISPAISISITKWIFAGCIILSFINLAYEYARAYRVIKRDAVAESYLDTLAVRLQSIRMGQNGHGWRRFLVFAELTRSKKGAEYIALFTYFSFQAWIRIIFCSGPRQVVNALTLYSVYVAKLDGHQANVGSSLLQFFNNFGILASKDRMQALILASMLFTLIIWVFTAISLLIAVMFYVLFLWHYIPNSDGGLSGYCERKINSRLTRIVSAKVNKALEDDERKKYRYARKAAKNGEIPVLGRQATLPTLFDAKTDDSLPEKTMLHRNDTMTTLPVYSSRPNTPSASLPPLPGSGFELTTLDQKRTYQRSATELSTLSTTSYNSNAPLLEDAGEMGYEPAASQAPTLPPIDTSNFPFPQRGMTSSPNGSQWHRGVSPPRQMTPDSCSSSQRGPPTRFMTQGVYTTSPTTYAESDRNSPRPQGSVSDSYGRPLHRTVSELSGRSSPVGAPMGRRGPFVEMGPSSRQSPAPNSEMGRSSPSLSMQRGQGSLATRDSPSSKPGMRLHSNLNPGNTASSNNSSGYIPYNPNPNMRNASAGNSSDESPFRPQSRPYGNITEPIPARLPPGDHFGDTPVSARQGTPQSHRVGYNRHQHTASPGPGSDNRHQHTVSPGPASDNRQQHTASPGPASDIESRWDMPRTQSPASYGDFSGQYTGYAR